MATEPYLGEIRAVSFGFAPRGWALCNGQTMAINQNQALFAILGTTYGGNGTTTFALPNLQGRVPVHVGSGIVLGQSAGAQSVTLTTLQAGHTHAVAANATPNSFTAAGNFPASAASGNLYGPTTDTSMSPQVISLAGGSQPHNNMQPYLVVNYIIAIQGVFPSRN